MAGPFSGFLSLNSKPGLKAKAAAKQNETGYAETTKKEIQEQQGPAQEGGMSDKEDEWYDTESSAEPTPVKKKSESESHVEGFPKSLSEEEQKLVKYIPSLFSLALPPCGLEAQVAYESLVARLRARWLAFDGHDSPLSVCHALKKELTDQNYLWPPFSVKGKFKRRKPWCRENVFKYQLHWIEYFVREAENLEANGGVMTDNMKMDRRKESSVPQELRFSVERPDVLRLWDVWNEAKRAPTPKMPVADEEMMDEVTEGGKSAPDSVAEAKTEGTVKETQSLPASSEETLIPTTAANDVGNDAHLWSDGGHD